MSDPRRDIQAWLKCSQWFGLEGVFYDREKLAQLEREMAASSAPGQPTTDGPGPKKSLPTSKAPQVPEIRTDLSLEDRKKIMAAVVEQAEGCTKCRLSEKRKKVVVGSGSVEADLMLIGEGPGANEDIKGLPFVGAAGQLLTKMLKAIDIDREGAYITNVVKCRPPRNRDPEPDEVAACRPYLWRQVEACRPKCILTLGAYASRTILEKPGSSLRSLRGKVWKVRGIQVVATYHPSALLRNASMKKPAWEDLKMLQKLLNES